MNEDRPAEHVVMVRHPSRGALALITLVIVLVIAFAVVMSRDGVEQGTQRGGSSGDAPTGDTAKSDPGSTPAAGRVGSGPSVSTTTNDSVSASSVPGTDPPGATTTTMDPRIRQLADDLVVDTRVAEDVIKVGEPFHVTVTVTNRSSHAYEVWGACGVPAAVEVAQRRRFNAPFEPVGSLPGIPGANFSALSPSLTSYLQYSETEEPDTILSNRVSISLVSSPPVCGGFSVVVIAAGATVSGTLTGFVSPGPAWPATPTLTVITFVGLPDVSRQSFVTTSSVGFEDDPTRESAYYRAVADAGASPAVMGWVAAHQGPKPDWPAGGVPVEVDYRRGQWRIRMSANISADANADLLITTEHGTGRITDIRELRDGVEASNDPDAIDVDESKETVIYRA